MNIAHFNATVKKDDGVGRVMLKIIEETHRRGEKSLIITGHAENPDDFPAKTVVVPSIRFPLYGAYHLPVKPYRSFERELRDFRPDLLHVHSPEILAWAALRYSKKYKVPIIITHHTNFIQYLPYYHLSALAPLLWRPLRKLYNQCDFVTCPSSVVADNLKDHGIKNVITLPWGVDVKNFGPAFRSEHFRQQFLKDQNTKIILFLSRLVWEKDIATLAKTYKLLLQNKANVSMLVAGDGPAKRALRKLMPGANFLGSVSGADLKTMYASSDIFLFPSTTETFGIVTIEAMASGSVPVVARAGGSSVIVKDGENGMVAEPKNPESFYQKIIFLLERPDELERLKKAGLECAQRFDWGQALEALFGMYAEAIQSHRLSR